MCAYICVLSISNNPSHLWINLSFSVGENDRKRLAHLTINFPECPSEQRREKLGWARWANLKGARTLPQKQHYTCQLIQLHNNF